MTATTRVHLPKPVSSDLTKSDSVLTNLIGKGGARLVDVIKYLPYKVFLLQHHHYKGGQPRLKRYLLPMR